MKKLMFVTIAAAGFLTAGAQVKEGKIVYERKMNMHKRLAPESENMKAMMPEFSTAKTLLLFAGEESIYKNLPEEQDIREQAGQDGQRVIIRMGGGPESETYQNFAEEKTVERRDLGPKKYLIEDTLRKLAWKLSEETMTIKGYACKKATAKNRQGDNIVAWYTEAIPVPGGPELYGGLPGMILQLDISDGWISFTAVDIQGSLDKSLVKVPTSGKKITRKEFQKMMEETFGPASGNGGQIRVFRTEQ